MNKAILERWEYASCIYLRTDEFTQVSFVNGIYTSKGWKTCRLYFKSNY